MIGLLVILLVIFLLLFNSWLKTEVREAPPLNSLPSVPAPAPKKDPTSPDASAAPSAAEEKILSGASGADSPQKDPPKEIIYELPLNDKILIQ